MREEFQLIKHYIDSRDTSFLDTHDLNASYFSTTDYIVTWIEEFKNSNNVLPTLTTVKEKFEEFDTGGELEAIPYLVDTVKKNKVYIEYRPILTKSAELLAEGQVYEAISNMRTDIEDLNRVYTSKVTRYDWVKDAPSRFDSYMELHNREGLAGISTGINALDELTGGWMEDDLTLIAGRLGDGKSLISLFFSYQAWLSNTIKGINKPIVFFSTEMTERSIAYRLDTMRAHFSNRALNRGNLVNVEDYKEYLMELEKKSNSFIILTEESNGGKAFTPYDIRRVIESERPGLVTIDQLYDLSDGTGETDIRRRIVRVSGDIREVNLSTKTPMIWVAQAGREAAKDARKDKNASPEIDQIQESDAPAQRSTKVITLRLINGEVFKLSLKKNREDEKNKDIFLRASIDTGYYEEVDETTMVF